MGSNDNVIIVENDDKLLYSNFVRVISNINDFQIRFSQRSISFKTNDEVVKELATVVMTPLEVENLIINLTDHLESYKENYGWLSK